MTFSHETILNALPWSVLAVDDDMRIRYLNSVASALFGPDSNAELNLRGGEAIQCLHHFETAGGCGKAPPCRSCVMRNSVENALRGQHTIRRQMKAVRLVNGIRQEHEILVTASPLPVEYGSLSILTIEDISQFAQLRKIVPVCAWCKKIRDDEDHWQAVDIDFRHCTSVDFSHGICPSCFKSLYPDY